MTKINFFKKNNKFVKLEVSGHTGYNEHGKDILCAAISSIAQSGALGLSKVLNLNVKIVTNDESGYFLVELPQEIEGDGLELSQIIFKTMYESFLDLKSGYSKYIKLEVR